MGKYTHAHYQSNILGDGADFNALIDGLNQTTKKANDGDSSSLEGMLIGQATALQTIFTRSLLGVNLPEPNRKIRQNPCQCGPLAATPTFHH